MINPDYITHLDNVVQIIIVWSECNQRVSENQDTKMIRVQAISISIYRSITRTNLAQQMKDTIYLALGQFVPKPLPIRLVECLMALFDLKSHSHSKQEFPCDFVRA